jgi:hypothetical protein
MLLKIKEITNIIILFIFIYYLFFSLNKAILIENIIKIITVKLFIGV